AIDYYLLFVNGRSQRTFGADTTEASIRGFDASDTRRFTLLAVDKAGNIGSFSEALIGVPALVGLTVAEAKTVLAARGLRLAEAKKVQGVSAPRSSLAVIVGQVPAAPAVVVRGSSVSVVLGQSSAQMALEAGTVSGKAKAGEKGKPRDSG